MDPGPGLARARHGDQHARPQAGHLTTAAGGGTAGFTDNPARDENAWAADADRSTPDKTVFTTGPLTAPLRVSGGGSVTLTATPSTGSARLSAVLVDLGPATIRDYQASGEGITTLGSRSCWGDGTAGDSACFLDTAADTAQVGATVFSRGWADLGHYAGLDRSLTLTPGTAYPITFDLAGTDHVVPTGHRLALIVAGTDHGLIDPPSTRPTVGLDLARSFLRLPLVGGLGPLPPQATPGNGAELPALTAGPAGTAARPWTFR